MLVVFWVLAGVDVLGILLDVPALEWAAKPLLAPALALWLWRRTGRAHALVLAALAFACAGDIALLVPGRPAFLLGMAFFLGTQLCFTTAFWRAGAAAHLRARPRIVAAYGLVWLVAVAALGPLLGPALGTAIGLYALALTVMAATARVLGPLGAWGGAVFLVSDLLVGLGAAGVDFTGRDVLVMLSYAAALLLLVRASAAPRAPRPEPRAGEIRMRARRVRP